MEFIDVLNARHSARAFTREPIPEDRLQRVLERAAAAPSWSNTQPYQIALAQGADLAALGDELSERFERLAPLQRAPAWKKALAAVRRNRHEIRHLVVKGGTMKHAPEIRFEIDGTFDQMDATRALLAERNRSRQRRVQTVVSQEGGLVISSWSASTHLRKVS